MRQKFPVKSVVVIAEMLVIGSASLYFIQLAYPGGGFVLGLLAVSITGLVTSFFFHVGRIGETKILGRP